MPANQYGLSMVRFGGATPADIGGIKDWRLDNGIAEIVESSDGEVDPRFAASMTQAQKVRFRSTDIKAVLDLIGVGGRSFVAAGTYTSCSFHFRKRAAGGIYSGGSNEFVISGTVGLAVPVSVRASHGQLAEIEVEIEFVSDGTNPPLAADTGATLPAFTFGPTQMWTIGPAYLNATLVEGLQDMTVDFGIETEPVKGDGFPWPTQVSIKQRRPSMRFDTFHLDAVDDDVIALIGQARSGSTRLFLRKKAEGGANVADATTQHIRFDVAEGRIHMESLGASHPNSALTQVVITPTHNGSVDSVVVNTAVAVA